MVRAPYLGLRPPVRNRSDVLLRVGRATMLPALHELLIEGNALLAEGTRLRRVRREITTHEAEDLLAVEGHDEHAAAAAEHFGLALELTDDLGRHTGGRR